MRAAKRTKAQVQAFFERSAVRLFLQYTQFVLAIVFVVLYVYATYSPPAPDSLRHNVDLGLCIVFALEYLHRMLVSAPRLSTGAVLSRAAHWMGRGRQWWLVGCV